MHQETWISLLEMPLSSRALSKSFNIPTPPWEREATTSTWRGENSEQWLPSRWVPWTLHSCEKEKSSVGGAGPARGAPVTLPLVSPEPWDKSRALLCLHSHLGQVWVYCVVWIKSDPEGAVGHLTGAQMPSFLEGFAFN